MIMRSASYTTALAICLSIFMGQRAVADVSASDAASLVAQTHEASLAARERVLRRTIAKPTCWPYGVIGDTFWALSALYLNEQTDEANRRLLEHAKAYIELRRKLEEDPEFSPENKGGSPWGYFQITSYVRTLCLFSANSTHLPGRLKPETEAAMKEALWLWAKGKSRVEDATLDHLLVLLGTENHDLTLRPNYYLLATIFKDDPAYKDRLYTDGHTAVEHAAAYVKFFRAWPAQRARSGLWVEMGSDTYQKYAWPALFNLHELSPDEEVRKRFGQLLDLALIEEAQVSILGRRGGGRSRAGYAKNNFEGMKNLLYAPPDVGAGSSHSRAIETSRYQAPAAAILLRKTDLTAAMPFVIRNRVLGETALDSNADDAGQRLAGDSALVNYAYRTPSYLLGSTLQDPSLSMPGADGKTALRYAGISRQNRWCGMLFQADTLAGLGAVYPQIQKTAAGRPQHPYWSVQHENVLLIQRIAPQRGMGSYSTGKISIRFAGRDLKPMERNGWIFAQQGDAYIAVKFLDGGHEWDAARQLASPADFQSTSMQRILLHAGGRTTHGSFTLFTKTIISNTLRVTDEQVDYHFHDPEVSLQMWAYHPDKREQFKLPQIDNQTIGLRTKTTYQSPFLNAPFASDKIKVTVGPITQVIDFAD